MSSIWQALEIKKLRRENAELQDRLAKRERENKRLKLTALGHEEDCACLPEDRTVTETVSALRRERDEVIGKYLLLDFYTKQKIARLEARVEHLEHALAVFGAHDESCDLYGWEGDLFGPDVREQPCSCGLDAVLAPEAKL